MFNLTSLCGNCTLTEGSWIHEKACVKILVNSYFNMICWTGVCELCYRKQTDVEFSSFAFVKLKRHGGEFGCSTS